ncbi:MAG: hypothetical protein HYY92_01160 [Parcubacteria group bacterium]|nr:hypothetical protein [Parcubacteria group bacterium]
MPEIIPAIMPRSFTELREYVEQVKGIVNVIQIDVMDGVFVPEKSWPYTDGDYEGFLRLAVGDESLDAWAEMDFEVDLMVANPETEIKNWFDAGVRRVIVHIESTDALPQILSMAKDNAHDRHEEDSFYAPREIGIAIDLETPNESLDPWMRDADFVQFMGIAKIGYQGQPFDERVIQKVKEFREKYPDVTISVDGGVSLETASRLIEAGANRLVAGSAIWKSEDIEETIEKFKQLGI